MKKHNLSVVIEKDKHGYVAMCPQIQGCYTQGKTYEEAVKNIKDAIKLCLASMTLSEEKAIRQNASLLSLTAVEV